MPLDPEVRILKAYRLTQVCRVVVSEQDIFGAQQWINRKRERERLDSLKAVRISRSKIIREDDQSQSSSSSKDSNQNNHTIHVPPRPSSQPPIPPSTSAAQLAGCVSSPESIGSFDVIDEELSIRENNEIKSYREPLASSSTAAYRSPVTHDSSSGTTTDHTGGGDDLFEFRFPHNMEDLHRLKIPHTKMKAVTLEPLNEVFIIRAERGAVDWNLYYKNSLQEFERYNLYTKGLLGKAAEYTPYRRMDYWVPELTPKKGKKSRPAEGSSKSSKKGKKKNQYHSDGEDDGDNNWDEDYDDDVVDIDKDEAFFNDDWDEGMGSPPEKPQKKDKGRAKKDIDDGKEDYSNKYRRRKVHNCDQCSFSTTSIRDFKNHTAAHGVGVDPITCCLCGVVSFSDADFKRHQYEDHSGPQQLTRIQYYTCKSCDLEFTDYREYECHLVNHIRPEENGFTCSVSNCTFTSSKYTTLVSHCKSTHMSFRCTFCNKSFAKLEQTEKHSAQTHKQFGRPFKCSLCEFRSATFGIYMRHREHQHGILTVTSGTTTTEKCKLCEEEFIFPSFEIQIQHLAFHAGQFLLYRCRECEFRADSPSKFHDHGMEYHIGFMIDDNNGDLWYPPDLSGLVDELDPIVRKRFGLKGVKASAKKSLLSARDKPTAIETQSAVEALLLDESEEQELETSHVDNEINLSEFEEIMSSIPPLTSPTLTAVDDSLLTSLSSSLEELTPMKPVRVSPLASRPKRKSFVDAAAKINKDAREEEERKQHAADKASKGISLPLIPDMSLPLNQSNRGQSSQESAFVDYGQGHGPSYSSQQVVSGRNGDNAYLSDVQSALTSTSPVASPLTTQLTAAAAALDAVYDPTHQHLYVNGTPIVDETGRPLQVEEEDIPNLLNTIASSFTVVDVHQQQMVGQPMDVSYVDPITGQYVQQLPTSLAPSVPTMGQFTQADVYSQQYQQLQPQQQFYGVAQQQVPMSLSDTVGCCRPLTS